MNWHNTIFPLMEEWVVPWNTVKGDKTLRLGYDDLDERSVVFDLGGYEGQWASDIHAKYGCTVHVFEPVPQYAQHIAQRFCKNPKIIVHDFGLSHQTGNMAINVQNDWSSVFDNNQAVLGTVESRFVCITDFLQHNNIQNVDLMKINAVLF